MRVAIEQQLVADRLGEEVEQRLRGNSQVLLDVAANVAFEGLGEQLVDFGNKNRHLGNELNQTLGYQKDTVVLANVRASHDNVSDLLRDLGERQLLLLHFLADQHPVDLGSEGALKSNVRSGAAHKPDEMVIFF